jgi:hypothetical protein
LTPAERQAPNGRLTLKNSPHRHVAVLRAHNKNADLHFRRSPQVGFSGAGGNRMGLVLFRHATETYLVQCLTGYDDMVVVSCYELH